MRPEVTCGATPTSLPPSTLRENLLKQREHTLAELARIDTCLVSGNPILDMSNEALEKFRLWF